MILINISVIISIRDESKNSDYKFYLKNNHSDACIKQKKNNLNVNNNNISIINKNNTIENLNTNKVNLYFKKKESIEEIVKESKDKENNNIKKEVIDEVDYNKYYYKIYKIKSIFFKIIKI